MIEHFKVMDESGDIDDRLRDYDPTVKPEKDDMGDFKLVTHFDVNWGDNPRLNMLPGWMPSIHTKIEYKGK